MDSPRRSIQSEIPQLRHDHRSTTIEFLDDQDIRESKGLLQLPDFNPRQVGAMVGACCDS